MGIRFRPPRLTVPPELGWVLARAFGPPEVRLQALPHDDAAWRLACRLDLAARIGTRTPLPLLEAEVGAEAARGFVSGGVAVALADERCVETARLAAAAAAALGIEPIFLKGMALRLAGAVRPGSRFAGDVDVLVDPGQAAGLESRLVEAGWAASPQGETGHHLRQLQPPGPRSVLEIHVLLPGVCLGGGRFASAADLRRAGLVERVDSLGAPAAVPVRRVLVAHALVHGVAQHGLSPREYPATRMLADLADLGAGEPDRAGDWAAAVGLVAADVDAQEAEAVRELVRALSAGILPETGASQLILDHVLAGALDDRYARAVAHSGLGRGPTRLARRGHLRRDAWRTLFLSRGAVDAIYGRPRSRWGYAARRVLRPFDLAWRVARSAAASLSLRLASRGRR